MGRPPDCQGSQPATDVEASVSAPLLGGRDRPGLPSEETGSPLQPSTADRVPFRHGFAVFMCAMCNGVNITLPFTIAVYIVRGFGIHDEVQVGKMTGLLSALYQVGQFCTSYLWGRVSDRAGRKVVVQLGSVSNAVWVVLLAFANNYWQACVVRLLAGGLNGIPGAIRCIAGESKTANSQASLVLLMSIGWGLGTSIGPIIGAVFSNPCEAYGHGFPLCGEHGLFQIRPYLLPCLATLVINATGVTATMFMTETLNRERQPRPVDRPGALPQSAGRQQQPLPHTPSLGYLCSETEKGDEDTEEPPWWKIPAVQVALIGLPTVAFINNMWDELTPIYASAAVSDGGLSLKTYELGIPLSIGGLSLFLYAMLVYKKAQRRFGVKALARYGLCIYAPLALLFPATSAVMLVGKKGWALGCLCALTILRRVMGVNVTTSTTMILNLSAPRTHLGAVNGFGQSMVALCRALGPGLGGYLWSASLALHIPYHQYLPYCLVALCSFATAFLYSPSLPLPDSRA